jgi:L-alanine-DL-glutamate epimerase-like enolase superfamily enzyme
MKCPGHGEGNRLRPPGLRCQVRDSLACRLVPGDDNVAGAEIVGDLQYFAFRPRQGEAGGEMSTEAIIDYCLKMREEHGTTFFEGKLILGDPQLEIRTVRMLREALGPEAMIRLDSNMQWSLTTARWVLREIEPYNIRNYEDPVATFEEMAALRQHSRIPFSTEDQPIISLLHVCSVVAGFPTLLETSLLYLIS